MAVGFTCVKMCLITMPVFQILMVSSLHTFLSKLRDQYWQCSSTVQNSSGKCKLLNPRSPSSTCNLIFAVSFLCQPLVLFHHIQS